MQFHQLKRKTKNKKHVQIGRGGKRGKTSGRGTKGQKARAGHKIRPEIRDTIKRLPKLRGYAFRSIQDKPVVVSLEMLEKVFQDGAEINISALVKACIVPTYKGKYPRVKIVGDNKGLKFSKKITVSGIKVSQSVKDVIEKVGGKIKSDEPKVMGNEDKKHTHRSPLTTHD
ncbi:MAG TPA: uL15 family ribosomal protein [Candidatus Paceibacterota bacterium]